MKNTLVILLLIFFTVSCNTKQRTKNKEPVNEYIEFANKKYQEVITQGAFPQNILSHFPKKIDKFGVTSTYLEYMKAYNYIFFTSYGWDKEAIDKLSNVWDGKTLATYNSVDTSMYVMGEFDSHAKIQMGEIPIPYFKSQDLDNPTLEKQIYSENNKAGLSEDFIIYILDANSIYNKNSDALNLLPKSHNKGYSYGLCINEEIGVVIYWTIVF